MEYYAALAPWAVFNVNRDTKKVDFMEPLDFMLQRRARLALDDKPGVPQPVRGRPALLLAPVPPEGRYAMPGERPPSKYGPGQSDGVIERYDAYARGYWAGKVKRHVG